MACMHRLGTNSGNKRLAQRRGRNRVLASDKLTINGNLVAKDASLDKLSTRSNDLVLDKHGHGAGQLDEVLLLVGEAGNLPALDDVLVINLYVDQGNGSVADGRDDLSSAVKLLDHGDGVGIVNEVVQRAVAAGEEDGVELGGAAAELLDGGGVLPQGLLVFVEVHGDGVVLGALEGAVVERGDTALGGDDGDLDVLLGEEVVGVGEFRLCVCACVSEDVLIWS